MTKFELQKKREYLMDIDCDFIYLIATCKYSDLNQNRENELKKLKAKIKKIDAQLEQLG